MTKSDTECDIDELGPVDYLVVESHPACPTTTNRVQRLKAESSGRNLNDVGGRPLTVQFYPPVAHRCPRLLVSKDTRSISMGT